MFSAAANAARAAQAQNEERRAAWRAARPAGGVGTGAARPDLAPARSTDGASQAPHDAASVPLAECGRLNFMDLLPATTARKTANLAAAYDRAELTAAAAAMGANIHDVLKAAYSDGYMNFMGRTVAQYNAFCVGSGIDPAPISFHKLSGFYIDYCVRRGLSPESLGKIHSVMSKVARLSYLEWALNSVEEELLKVLMRGLGKLHKGQNARGQVDGLYMRDLELMEERLRAAPAPASPADEQKLLMFDVMHQGLLRSGELGDGMLRAGDVTFVYKEGGLPTLAACEGVRLRVRDPKTDKLGAGGQVVYLAQRDDRRDVVGRMHAHLARHGLLGASAYDRPLFTELTPQGERTELPITYEYLLQATKEWARAIGRDDTRIGGHSFRVGGTNDLFQSGAPLDSVMAHGRWKSLCWFVYKRADASIIDTLKRMAPSARHIDVAASRVAAPSGPPSGVRAPGGTLVTPAAPAGAQAHPPPPREEPEMAEGPTAPLAHVLDRLVGEQAEAGSKALAAAPRIVPPRFSVGTHVMRINGAPELLYIDAPADYDHTRRMWWANVQRVDARIQFREVIPERDLHQLGIKRQRRSDHYRY
jgi:hypothetical protein